MTPHDITEAFAHLSNHLLLITAHQIHKETEDGLFDLQTDACDTYTKFSKVGELTTFATVNSIWQYANRLKRSNMSMPRIFWLDTENYTELLYKGQKVTLTQIQFMISDLQQKLVTQFQQLTFGLLDEEELETLKRTWKTKMLVTALLMKSRTTLIHPESGVTLQRDSFVRSNQNSWSNQRVGLLLD